MRVVEAVVRRLAVGLAVAMLGLGAMLWAALAVAGQAAAETRAALTESRVALVVGNSAYQHTAALTNPLNDARDLAAALQRTGFEVIVATDADKRQMDGALRAFAEKLGSADVALFFYAGHGLQVSNENYLVPVDARLASQRDLEFEAVKLDFVLRQMEIDRDGKTTIVMLDACRDNPLTRSLARSMGTRSTAIGKGLAPASTGVGTFIAYATQPGNVALDGKGRNSPFTSGLLANIDRRGRNLNATMIEVRKSVIKSTGGKQVPWDHSALTGDFFFVPGEVVAGSQTIAPAGQRDDVEALKARLAALEDADQRRRTASTAASGAPDGERMARVAEARARLAVAEDKGRELQRKLLDARRVEGQTREPTERQRLLQTSMGIQRDMAQAFQTAKRLREEIASLAEPASAATPPPPTFGRAFNVRLGLRAVGAELTASPSTANCESRCRSEPRCLAYNLSRNGECELLDEVTRTVSASEWRTGERPCVSLGIGWAAPIAIVAGMKLCNGIGLHETRVEQVDETSVAFKGDGRAVRCNVGDVCQLGWPAGPPFSVRISGGAGSARTVEIVPRGR